MKIGRRAFVTQSSGFLFSFAPFLNIRTNLFNRSGLTGTALSNSNKILVFIHLAGGNDWFNTIIPYSCPVYYSQRPNLAIDRSTILKLNHELALHPALTDIKTAYDKNQVAVLLNCGLKEHDLSHHKAIRQALYLNSLAGCSTTWQARYAEYVGKGLEKIPAINIEPIFYDDASKQRVFNSKEKLCIGTLDESNGFEFNLDIHYKAENKTINSEGCVENGFVFAMEQVVNLIAENDDAGIYHISLGGFDTHKNQLEKHEHLLRMLNQGINTLQINLEKAGVLERVMIVVTSEFGRSLVENENVGTDHGYINHVLLIGASVNAGVYGELNLESENNSQINLSYENLLSVLLNDWLRCPSEVVLGQKYSAPNLIKKDHDMV